MVIGQNYAMGFNDWYAVIRTWHDEVNMYRYGENPDYYLGYGAWPKIAHYTQVCSCIRNVTQPITDWFK